MQIENTPNNLSQKLLLKDAMKKASEIIEGGVAVYVPNAAYCCHVGVIKHDSNGEKFLEALGTGKTWDEAFLYLEKIKAKNEN